MKLKFLIAFLVIISFVSATFSQPPLVYPLENTGSKFGSPVFPTIEQAPVIDPLTDPFAWRNGKGRSTKFSDWERRRNEIRLAIEYFEIGTKPARPAQISANYSASDSLLKVIITVNEKTLTLTAQVIIPAGNGPFPAVIGMNSPNGSLPADIFSSRNIARIKYSHNQVTTYNAPKNTDPFYQLYPELFATSGQYSAWAWGVSRIVDGLELVKNDLPIDLNHIAVTGCSYAGKMALFSGALDERIALTIPQESGGGGAPAWRVSEFMGDVEKLGATSHQWFKDYMFQYTGLNVSRLPYDHHELMAMVAPRALLVTGNTDYTWLSNQSAYISARAAKEVYRVLDIGDRMGFYIDGSHGHCQIPITQRPAIEAFVDKFLLGKTVNTDTVTINPYPNIDYKNWFNWWGTNTASFSTKSSGRDLWLEAEMGQFGSNWEKSADSAVFGVTYLLTTNTLGTTLRAVKDTVTNNLVIQFEITSSENYNFLARVFGTNGSKDSFWIRIDDGAFIRADNFVGKSGWQWGRLLSANLSIGRHRLTISCREDGARLDKILITTSMSSAIPSVQPTAGN